MKRWVIGLAVLVALVLLLLLSLYDPQTTWWFPKCPFHLLTGLECPGCGNQRAVYQLLHGNIGVALYYNAFLFISLPYLVMLIVTSLTPKTRFVKLRRITYHPTVVWCYVGAIIIWWVVRNIWFRL
jgi:hypothetical protein